MHLPLRLWGRRLGPFVAPHKSRRDNAASFAYPRAFMNATSLSKPFF